MKAKPAQRGLWLLLASSLWLLLLLIFVYVHQRGDVSHETGNWRRLALPDISQQPIRLRVTQVVNPRFPSLTHQQVNAVLRRTEQLMAEHFNVQVVLQPSVGMDIEQFFAYLPEPVRAARQVDIIDPQHISPAQERDMYASLLASMQATQTPAQQLIDYAQPYLLTQNPVDTLPQLAHQVLSSMFSRMQAWYAFPAADGRPVLDGSPYNEWVWWDSMGYGDLPMDVVITNQLVASLENYDQALHSCLRGGISGGTMTYSRNGRYGGYVFVSVFALLNNNSVLASLKDGKYSATQVIDYAAATLAHELGHLLFHYGHPFAAEGCIMAPTPLLRYRHWFDSLDPQACSAARHQQMQPGAAHILYNLNW